MEKLFVIKIGGNIIDDEKKLSSFVKSFAEQFSSDKTVKAILVHGGGKLATRLAEQLGVGQHLIEGRRITDAETLKIVTMVYAGYINKNLVAQLQSQGCNAVGICGADGNAIQSHKRAHPKIDYGFAGDIDSVNTNFLKSLLNQGASVVVAPITHNKAGLLLNTNADTIAHEVAQAMSACYEVHLVYCFEKEGVLRNVHDESSVIETITALSYEALKEKNLIFEGMLPKLDNAFAALKKGVSSVVIGNAERLQDLIQQKAGTVIIHE